MNEKEQIRSAYGRPVIVPGDFTAPIQASTHELQQVQGIAQQVAVKRVTNIMDFAAAPKVSALHSSTQPAQHQLMTSQAETTTEKKQKRSRKLHFPQLNIIQVFALAIIFCGAYLTYLSLATNKHIDVQVRALETKNQEQGNTNNVSTADGSVPSETPPPARESVYSYTRSSELPKRLEIDNLDLVAKIIDVGVDKNGNVDVPISLHDAGWYTGSTNPATSPGSSVMVGHVGGAKYGGIFANLKKVKTGTIIRVVMGNESRLEYKITSVESVPVASMQMADYLNFASQKKKTLYLITCTGKYNNSSLTYENRLVVTAEQL